MKENWPKARCASQLSCSGGRARCRAADAGEPRGADGGVDAAASVGAIGWRCDQNKARRREEAECSALQRRSREEKSRRADPGSVLMAAQPEPHSSRRGSAAQQIGIAVDRQPQAEESEGPD